MSNLPDISDICFARKDRKHCSCFNDDHGDGQCCRCHRVHPSLCQQGCGQPVDQHSSDDCPVTRGQGPIVFDLVAHVTNQQEFSFRTFGPLGQGQKPEGVITHLEKELNELRINPRDLEEWIDVVILGIDGATKSGYSPEQIVTMLMAKQVKNERRNWPDWRKIDLSQAIEHVRTPEEQSQKALESGGPNVVPTDGNGSPL